MEKSRGKQIRYFGLLIFMILLDQVIKLFIFNNHMKTHFIIIKDVLVFYPIQNKGYSYIGSLLGGIFSNYTLNIASRIIIGFVIYRTVKFILVEKIQVGKIGKIAIMLIIAGTICSFIDVVIWKGSLDFLCLFEWFIFDLKDVYISLFQLLMIYSVLFHYGNWQKINLKDWIRYVLCIK